MTQETIAPPGQGLAPVLDIHNLRTELLIDGQWRAVVRNVSLTIHRNETLALVGESGSGKSMTALSVLKLLPTKISRIGAGQILFEGKDLASLSERDLRRIRGNRIAMIFQEPMTSLNPTMRVGEQISEAIRAHKNVSRADARLQAEQLLQQVGIPSARLRLEDYPHQFSGGMRQRVMIAMAIACRPALLLADEPTTALDVTIQAQVLAVLAKLKSTYGMSMVFITHNLGVVALIADRVAVMYAGEIVEIAAVGDLYSEPMHPYTAALLDAMPRVDRTEDVQPIPGSVPALTDIPSGCAYAARCPLKQPCCEKDHPELLPIDGTNQRFVRCFVRSAK